MSMAKYPTKGNTIHHNRDQQLLEINKSKLVSNSSVAGIHSRLTSSSSYWCLPTEQPQAPHPLLHVYIPSRSLQLINEWWLVVPSHRGTKSLSTRTFSFTVPCWWKDLTNFIRTPKSLTFFKKQLKTYLVKSFFPPKLKPFFNNAV